jgi:hypothetical protein
MYNRLLPNTKSGICAKFATPRILFGSYGPTAAVNGKYLGLGKGWTAGKADLILVQRHAVNGC